VVRKASLKVDYLVQQLLAWLASTLGQPAPAPLLVELDDDPLERSDRVQYLTSGRRQSRPLFSVPSIIPLNPSPKSHTPTDVEHHARQRRERLADAVLDRPVEKMFKQVDLLAGYADHDLVGSICAGPQFPPCCSYDSLELPPALHLHIGETELLSLSERQQLATLKAVVRARLRQQMRSIPSGRSAPV
jgi:hypothetical protein